MLILGLILSVFAIGFLCWLAFALAVHTLPLFIAITVGLAAYHHDAGLVGALLITLMAGVVTLAIGRMAFALMPSALLRALIALSFAVPAAMAGYEAAFGLIQLSVASHPWCSAFGAVKKTRRIERIRMILLAFSVSVQISIPPNVPPDNFVSEV